MVADQGIGRRLSDGGLGAVGDPSRISLGGATGYYVDEQGMPMDIHQWPPQKPSVKAEYERPFKYDSEGNITETVTVLLPSTPNKDAKWLRRGFLRKRYVDPRAMGIDLLPRFNQGLGERKPERRETLAQFHARREEQRIRAEIERERWEAELGKDESDTDEPVEIEIPSDMVLSVALEQPEDSPEVAQLKRELEVARKTVQDMIAKGVGEAVVNEPIIPPNVVIVTEQVDSKEAKRAAQSARMKERWAAKRAAQEAVA